ncbi:MAG: hypothetical protein LBJ40_17720 [Delftia acidovorans]|jgi:hypothetical protein|nr:hypothetical protein [Delftia acidovorans]
MTAITTAARLLRVAADELKNAHTIGGDWGNEHEALDAYNEHMATATTLEHMARGCLAQIEEPAQPVLYVSPGQLAKHSNPEGPESAEAGRYLPARVTPAGKFTLPLYAGAAPAAVAPQGDYPPLPEGVMCIEQVGGEVIGRPTDYGFKHGRGIVHGAELFTSEQLRAYFDLGRQPASAPALEAPAALLTKPALVGGGRFGVGVPERYVIEAAQRHHEREGQREAMTAEQFADEERKRRTLWELIHGPLVSAPQQPRGREPCCSCDR